MGQEINKCSKRNCKPVSMSILYLGSFFPTSRYEEILSNSIGVIQYGGDTYQKAILYGLSQQLESFKIITSPMLGSFPVRYKKLLFKSSLFKHLGINDCVCSGFINLTLYKNLSRYLHIKNYINHWIETNSGVKQVIVFTLDISFLRALYEIKGDHPELRICLIVTDLIRYYVVPESVLSKPIMKYFEKRVTKYLTKVNSFVLLTESMREDLKVGKRPYVVIEGIYNNSDTSQVTYQIKEKAKTILYTGTLAGVYGIKHLLDAFSKIENENYRLWICGDGDCKDEIRERAKIDSRIKFFGQLKREEVLTLQKRATVLINPRLSDSEFTRYSFPSKTMEYLASGTPTIMHPLKCLSKEYLSHMFIANDETDLGLRDTLINVCEKEQKDLESFGREAANFVIKEKNSTVQVNKILNLINIDE